MEKKLNNSLTFCKVCFYKPYSLLLLTIFNRNKLLSPYSGQFSNLTLVILTDLSNYFALQFRYYTLALQISIISITGIQRHIGFITFLGITLVLLHIYFFNCNIYYNLIKNF